MSDNLKYWIWLQNSLGYANAKINTVRRFYPSVEDFYKGGIVEWRFCGCFTNKELNSLCKNTLDKAQKTVDRCNQLGYTALTPDMEEYPQMLKEIYDPPAVLYVNGKLPDVDHILSIGIVGTRNATLDGKKLAYSMAYDFAKSGVNVISGGALGIDSSAHNGTLAGGGKTICVLGCGINSNYLMSNAPLRRQIAQSCAVVSEYPPDIAPQKYSFPQRNRIISALSQGIVVIEAGEKSGALITASVALSQNKDIFSVPGSVNSKMSYGTNMLIKQGAKAVTCAKDVIDEYNYKYHLEVAENSLDDEVVKKAVEKIPTLKRKAISVNEIILQNKKQKNNAEKSGINRENIAKNTAENINADVVKTEKTKKTEKKQLTDVSENAKKIYDIIFENPSSVDDIVIKTRLPVFKIMQALTELELEEVVERKSGGKYHIV